MNFDGRLRIKSEEKYKFRFINKVKSIKFRITKMVRRANSSTFVTFIMSVDLTTVSVDSVIVANGLSMLNGGDCVPFTVTESER